MVQHSAVAISQSTRGGLNQLNLAHYPSIYQSSLSFRIAFSVYFSSVESNLAGFNLCSGLVNSWVTCMALIEQRPLCIQIAQRDEILVTDYQSSGEQIHFTCFHSLSSICMQLRLLLSIHSTELEGCEYRSGSGCGCGYGCKIRPAFSDISGQKLCKVKLGRFSNLIHTKVREQ